MIRRNPTLIPMTDSDVQDIREIVANAKAEEQGHQSIIETLTKLTQKPGITRDDRAMQHLLAAMKEGENREKEKKDAEALKLGSAASPS